MNFTVEATTDPVENNDWGRLYNVLDAVPGSLLLENPEAPVLIIPVEAEEPMKAALFVDGLSKLLEISVTSGKIYPTPTDEYEFEEDEAEGSEVVTDVVRALDSYVADAPDFHGHLTEDGRLVVNC